MWSTFVPCLISLVFILYLLSMKIYFDKYASQSTGVNDPLVSGLGSVLLLGAHVKSDHDAARTP